MPLEKGAHRKVFESVVQNETRPVSKNDCSQYTMSVVEKCRQAVPQNTPAPTMGRITGDWFEWTIAKCLEIAFGRSSYQTSEDIGGKTRNIPGFEKGFVRWLPCPDIILKTKNDFMVVVSAKWGLRPDRRFAEPYIAMKIKTVKPSVKYLILTNTSSSPNTQVLMEAPEIDKVYHLRPDLFGGKLLGLSNFPTLIDDLSAIIGVKSNL